MRGIVSDDVMHCRRRAEAGVKLSLSSVGSDVFRWCVAASEEEEEDDGTVGGVVRCDGSREVDATPILE